MAFFCDAHCHADSRDPVRPAETVGDESRCRILCGVSPDDWPRVAAWADAWQGTVPAFGIHPWQAAQTTDSWERELERLLLSHPRAWVGEIGLDKARTTHAPMAAQMVVMEKQLHLAARLRRRINVHCVKAYDPLFALLENNYFAVGMDAFIMHSFNGPHQMIARCVERGGYFSLGPLASERNTHKIRTRTALIPAERMLVESDAFLRFGHDADKSLDKTLAWLAEVKHMRVEEMAQVLEHNARQLLARF